MLLLLGAMGIFALFISAVSPLDDLVQQEFAQKTWCDGSRTTQVKRSPSGSQQPSGFPPPRSHEPAITKSAGECPSPVTLNPSTVVVASEDSRGPPLLFHPAQH
ncbi:MAG: hypothetical protein ACHP7P_02600 [Terriglobales bacterium]